MKQQPPEEEAAKSKSVSLVPSLWQRVEEAAGGNRSEFVRKAVLVALDAAEIDASVIQKLARTYHPVKAAKLRQYLDDRKALAGDDSFEPQLLQNVLDALIRAFGDPNFDPRRKLAIVDETALDRWEEESGDRIRRLAEELHTIQSGGSPLLQASRSRYNGPKKPTKETRPKSA